MCEKTKASPLQEPPTDTGDPIFIGLSRYILCPRCSGHCEAGPEDERVVSRRGKARRTLRCDFCNVGLPEGSETFAVSMYSCPDAYWRWEPEFLDLEGGTGSHNRPPTLGRDVTRFAARLGIVPPVAVTAGVLEKCVGPFGPPDKPIQESPELICLLTSCVAALQHRPAGAMRVTFFAPPRSGVGPAVEIVAECGYDEARSFCLFLTLPGEQ